MKVVQYFKHTRNLNAYVKKYKRLTHALMCIFILCAAFVLTSHAGAETHDLQNYTYVSYSQSSDLDDEETLHLLTVDESTTAPVYVINDHNNITSVKVSTDKNSEGVENGTITPNTNYLKFLFCKWVVIIRLFTMFRAHCISISHSFWRQNCHFYKF